MIEMLSHYTLSLFFFSVYFFFFLAQNTIYHALECIQT